MADKIWTWQRNSNDAQYLVSSARDLLDRSFINTVFSSSDMLWARPLETNRLEAMLALSQTLGLYHSTSSSTSASAFTPANVKQIGMARFVTDYITTTYLCDVYVLPEYRGTGLGKWLIQCCDEVVASMPALRRIILHSGPGGMAFYTKELGVWDVAEEKSKVVVMTRRTYPLE